MFLDLGLLCAGCRVALSLSSALPSLPSGAVDSHLPHASRYAPCVSRRHSIVRPTPEMGRMDRPCCDDSHHRKWDSDLRDEENIGQPKGAQEEDRREPGYERRQFLLSAEDAIGNTS